MTLQTSDVGRVTATEHLCGEGVAWNELVSDW